MVCRLNPPGTSTICAQRNAPYPGAISTPYFSLNTQSTASNHHHVPLAANRVGWGSLCIAGGGAYYFAKKSINADRAHRHEEAQRRKEEALRRELSTRGRSSAQPPSTAISQNSPSSGGGLTQAARSKSVLEMDDAASPSREAGHDPAATRHEPETLADRVNEKGKYEAAESYTSKKGNRL
ncbi:hypothetical protein ACJ72_03747 [Emergomyces africanus]|uniref:Uncharacterized protein n=1 Tax=Emergomyces africanus TaxID=1955775 RepID=A0A1B7NYR7_9EURO|nr:hypothetical protein ACJ72_03747 [Emergomyces africanus]